MGYFSKATLKFLTVGHTHEDVDRLFAMILLLVLRPKNWETPADMVKLITEALRPMSTTKKEELIVEEVEHIRDFDQWLDGMGVKMHNAFVSRNGREASHSFIYKPRTHCGNWQRCRGKGNVSKSTRRTSLPLSKAACTWLRHSRQSWQSHIVSCLVSGQQPPRLKMARDMPKERQKELEKLADHLDCKETSGEHYPHAARCIRDRLLGQAPPEQAPHLEFLSHPTQARQPVARTSNQYYEHLPDTAWRLLVSFRRAAGRS
jgi:hypothetical protein